MKEVNILGRGIAGLVLSYLLEKAGVDHLVLSRKEEVSPVALGETIPPSAMPLLHDAGLFEFFKSSSFGKTSGYHSQWGSDRVTDHHFYQQGTEAHGLKIDKAKLVQQLSQLQQHRLVEIKALKAITEAKDTGHVTIIDQSGEQFKGRMWVDATGRKRAGLKLSGIAETRHDEQVAFACHLPGRAFKQLPYGVFMESFADGWGIVSTLDANRNVMTLFTAAKNPELSRFRKYADWPVLLKDTTGLRFFLSDQVTPKVLGYDASTSFPAKVAGKNWLAIGDAAMAFDPLSSHGITNAIWTANRAADLIRDAVVSPEAPLQTAQYQQQINRIFDGYAKARQQLYEQKWQWENAQAV